MMQKMKFLKLLGSTLIAISLVILAACVQMPTEKQGVADLRPQISFKVDMANSNIAGSRIYVDGIDVGAAADFVDGVNSLRILPGTHQIKVVSNGGTIFEERVYIGDGVNKSFSLK